MEKGQVDSVKEEKCTDKPPANWQRVGEISNLTMYPVKSGKATPLQKAGCESLGLIDIANPHIQLRDREFIVYDRDKKKAVSGLVNTKTTLLDATIENETTIKLSFPEKEDFYLTLPIDESKVVTLDRWWGEVVSAVDCGDAVAAWLSSCLNSSSARHVRLGHFSRPTVPLRTIDNGWTSFANVYPRLRDQYLGAYSYMASYLIISQSSVDELNTRLSSPVTPSHFRGNMVVSGCEAYSEDSWDWIRIGDQVILRGFKPCTRCMIVAIDPATGKLDKNFEPLRTLKNNSVAEKHGEEANGLTIGGSAHLDPAPPRVEDEINEHFSMMGSGCQVESESLRFYLNNVSQDVKNEFRFSCVTEREVKSAINKITSGAVGSDGISINMIKMTNVSVKEWCSAQTSYRLRVCGWSEQLEQAVSTLQYEQIVLFRYRQVTDPAERELAGKGSEPVFGLYAGLHAAGTVQLGDSVYVGIDN